MKTLKTTEVVEPTRRHLEIEADRIASGYARGPIPADAFVPRDEVIRSYPYAGFAVPCYLNKTATPEQVRELELLFQELWKVNEEHAGDNTLETQAYCMLTGQADDLRDRFRAWACDYFTRRSGPWMLNAGVLNDTFLLFQKLLNEMRGLFEPLHRLKGTLNCTFLGPTMSYTTWLLYERLWKDRVTLVYGYFSVSCPPPIPDGVQQMAAYLSHYGWHNDRLGDFLVRLRPCCDPKRLAEAAGQPEEVTRAQLRSMAEDIQRMRPFLAKGFKPHKAALAFGGLVIAWEWWLNGGIGRLVIGESEAEMALACQTRECKYAIVVGRDGMLSNAHMPWLQPGEQAADWLGLSLLVLERFHELLFSMYDKIDFERVGLHDRVASDEDEPRLDDSDETSVAMSCQVLALSDAEPTHERTTPIARRIPGLRASRLFRLLADRFGCEVRPGKGSEMVVYRPGERMYSLKHHKSNPEVHPGEMMHLLKRLNIPVQDFVVSVRR